MTILGQPDSGLLLDEGRDKRHLCGMEVRGNMGGSQVMTHMQLYRDQKDCADGIGIFLHWAA